MQWTLSLATTTYYYYNYNYNNNNYYYYYYRKFSKTPGTRLPAQLGLVLECPTWQCRHGLPAGDKTNFASIEICPKAEHRPNSGQCMTKHGQNTRTDALPHATPVESKPPSFLCSRACHAETHVCPSVCVCVYVCVCVRVCVRASCVTCLCFLASVFLRV